MQCPSCQAPRERIVKIGFFKRLSPTPHRVQRYRCKACRKEFCDYTGELIYRDKRPELYRSMLLALCSGVSQRRCAIIIGTTRKTVDLKIMKIKGSLVLLKFLSGPMVKSLLMPSLKILKL